MAAARAAQRPLVDLTVSNPTEVGFALSRRALRALAAPAAARYDPQPLGLAAARGAVAQRVRAPAERILLTASTSEAYAFLFKLLCDPADEVLVPAPGYPLLDHLAALELVRLRHYKLHYDGGWHVDHASLAEALGPRTRAIVLVHPGNPTGAFVSRADLERIESVALERGLAIVRDEVFADYAYEARPPGAKPRALTFALGGLSKSAGLPQMKLGWMVVAGPPQLATAALERLEVIGDAFLSVGTPVQHALPVLLAEGERLRNRILRRVLRNRAHLARTFRGSPASLLESAAGWYAVLQLPKTRSDEAWALDLLERDGVLVQPGFLFDFDAEGFLVLSLLPRPAEFDRGIALAAERLGSG